MFQYLIDDDKFCKHAHLNCCVSTYCQWQGVGAGTGVQPLLQAN
jgi:hypothetical protein